MLSKNESDQQKRELVMIDQLVSEDHLLRAVNKYIEFGFLYDLAEGMYSKES
ncbi:hypothetical protein R9X47_16580 [Wukongibacter baidiensis]|uniref:hypothetical protein n=1 Tax=Wukongibacter baidiensis TaxID=1723361 RepID=UPI003D7FDF58